MLSLFHAFTNRPADIVYSSHCSSCLICVYTAKKEMEEKCLPKLILQELTILIFINSNLMFNMNLGSLILIYLEVYTNALKSVSCGLFR